MPVPEFTTRHPLGLIIYCLFPFLSVHSPILFVFDAQLLKEFPRGLWSTRFKVLYKEEFGQEPPSNLMDIVQTWTDVLCAEMSVCSFSQSLPIAINMTMNSWPLLLLLP